MPQNDWRSLARDIRSGINLAASPIGIRLLPNARELISHPDIRLLTKTAVCQMAAMARYNREEGVVAAASEGVRCLLGLSCLGLITTPDRVKGGSLNTRFTADERASRQLNESIRMIGNHGRRYGAIVMGPLDLIPEEPQVVAMYISPAQALRLAIAFAHRNGEAITTTITGQGSLCAAIAKSAEDRRIVFDLPCVGDRAYGLVQEHEMLVTFPADLAHRLVEGLRSTETVARHPFSPFLGWSPIIWPEFDSQANDFS